MKTIDKYILEEFLRIFLMSMLVMVSFYEMVSFIDMAGYFFKFNATLDMISRYMLFRAPMAVFHVTPICVLLASVLAIGGLARNSEIVAMKSAGMSMMRIAAPIIIASGTISFLAFLDSEYLFHLSARETNRIYYEEVKKQPRKTFFSKNKFWYKGDDGAIWNIGSLNRNTKTIKDMDIFRFGPDGAKITRRVSVAEGKLVGDKWRLKNYVERDFHEAGGFTEHAWPLRFLPRDAIPLKDLGKIRLDPEEMNMAQMRDYINDIRKKGYNTSRYVAEMYAKIGFPLISLVMPLLAIPMGVRSGRSGGMMVGIGVSVLIGVLFWFTFSTGLAFGRAGRIPPLLAVYGPLCGFGMAGLYMLFTDRQ